MHRAPVRIHRQLARADGVGDGVVPELAKEGGDENVLPRGEGSGGFLHDESLRDPANSGGVPDEFVGQAEAQGGGADVLLEVRVQLLVGAVHHKRLDAFSGLEARDHAAAKNSFAGQTFAALLGEVAKEALGPGGARGVLHDQPDAAADLGRLHLEAKKLVAV